MAIVAGPPAFALHRRPPRAIIFRMWPLLVSHSHPRGGLHPSRGTLRPLYEPRHPSGGGAPPFPAPPSPLFPALAPPPVVGVFTPRGHGRLGGVVRGGGLSSGTGPPLRTGVSLQPEVFDEFERVQVRGLGLDRLS